ncbi:MAG: selenocysteine-specific translation elongation factor [Holophagales bacterium]|nr:selenocysteine-specific translation elongation factor [Holophagales bacterium]MYF03890.1 selenocysteine-specific translation elongation factor [Holophagales bacterium]MYJ26768.1 selenocysteine-specific translation elongation factor [Holophagales bacterium]
MSEVAANRFVVGTAGHVDHGKTRLVQALTGIDCDRWEEEKQRGITIDLGFASMVEDGWQIGFVDVPGHERFVHNALAGLGGIQMMVLVVAADEGVMPQTLEHLAICSLLRIPAGLAVLSKTDLVSSELVELAELELEEALAETPFAGAPILPVSAQTGEGLDQLRAALVELAGSAAPIDRNRTLPARLPIDRAFHLRGLGVLVTGTLARGLVNVGDELDILPAVGRARVRSIEVHGDRRQQAEAGERTSLQLVGIDLEQVARGHELTAPGVYRATTSLLVRCRLLSTAPEPLDGSSPVRLHVNAAQRMGKLRPLEAERLMPGQEAVAEIRLDEPLVAVRGDRFVIRRPSPQTTLGGGEVLDPAWRRPRGRALGAAIDALNSGDRQAAAVQWTVDGREAGLPVTELALRLGVVPGDAEDVLNRAALDGLLLPAGSDRFVSAAAVRRVTRRARRLVEAHFAADRLSRGMPKAELVRRLLGARAADLASAYLDWSSRGGKDLSIVVEGELVTLPGRTSELTGAESQLARDLVEGFERQGLTPGSPEELCRSLGAKPQVFDGVLRYLVDRGKLVRLPNGLLLAAAALERFQADLFATGWDTFTVAEFKDRFGLTRKWAIPLLEHLDRQRLTRREGDRRRVLRPRGQTAPT